MSKYRTVVGVEYSGKRVEAGQVVSDIPEGSVGWLRQAGFIEPVAEPAPVEEKPQPVKKAAAKKSARKAAS